MDHAHGAKVIQFIMIKIVLHIAQLDQTITEKHVLLALLHKNGMEQNVLIDVIMEKYGM